MVFLWTQYHKCQIINIEKCKQILKFSLRQFYDIKFHNQNSEMNTFLLILCLKICTTLEHGGDDDDDDDEDLDDFYGSKEEKVKHIPWLDHYCTVMTCLVEIDEESSEMEKEQDPSGFEHGDDDDEDPQKDDKGTGKFIIKTKVCDGKCERHLGMTQLST